MSQEEANPTLYIRQNEMQEEYDDVRNPPNTRSSIPAPMHYQNFEQFEERKSMRGEGYENSGGNINSSLMQ
jgi:hypothetical protein